MKLKIISGAGLALLCTVFGQIDSRPQKTAAQIARDAFPSVVLLMLEDAKGQPFKLGSGFFVAKDTIATNFHVIDGAAAGYAKIVGQPTKFTIVGIVAMDPLHDLALLQLANSSAAPLPIADKLGINIGDAIYAIGNPIGLEGTFSQGIVSGVRALGPDRILQITAPISPGSSGGPVLDQTGTVVGVSVMSVVSGQNLNFAIPAEYVVRLQSGRTDIRPFKVIHETRSQDTLFGRIEGQPPRSGVVGENFGYDRDLLRPGAFSFSLHNKLADSVANVRGFVVFYDPEGKPLDTVSIDYKGVIPPRSAKRITAEVDASVPRLSESLWYWDDRTRSWRKATGNLYEDEKHIHHGTKTEVRKGKVEFRILDFSIEEH